MNDGPHLLFDIDGCSYAFPCLKIREILKPASLIQKDSFSSPIVGLFEYDRLHTIPVIDLQAYFTSTMSLSMHDSMGIIQIKDYLFAVLFPPILAIQSISSYENNAVHIIDPEKLLDNSLIPKNSIPVTKPLNLLQTDLLSFTIILVDQMKFAIQSDDIQEICHLGDFTLLPKKNNAFSGFKNLNGIITPLFDLGILLKLNPLIFSSFSKVIVCSFSSKLMGGIVDEVLDIVSFSSSEVNLSSSRIPFQSEEIEWLSLTKLYQFQKEFKALCP